MSLRVGPYQIIKDLHLNKYDMKLASNIDNDQFATLQIIRKDPNTYLDVQHLYNVLQACGRHPHILPFTKCFETKGAFFVVYSFDPTQPLIQRILRRDPWSVQDVIRVFIAVASAVLHLQQRGWCHRHISSGAVLLAQGFRHIKLIACQSVRPSNHPLTLAWIQQYFQDRNLGHQIESDPQPNTKPALLTRATLNTVPNPAPASHCPSHSSNRHLARSVQPMVANFHAYTCGLLLRELLDASQVSQASEIPHSNRYLLLPGIHSNTSSKKDKLVELSKELDQQSLVLSLLDGLLNTDLQSQMTLESALQIASDHLMSDNAPASTKKSLSSTTVTPSKQGYPQKVEEIWT